MFSFLYSYSIYILCWFGNRVPRKRWSLVCEYAYVFEIYDIWHTLTIYLEYRVLTGEMNYLCNDGSIILEFISKIVKQLDE